MNSELQWIVSEIGTHLFVVDGSRLYDFDSELPVDDATLASLVAELTSGAPRYIAAQPLAPPPLQTLSLNVAQACNMSCGYCYAGRGTFGGRARRMSATVARQAVDRLLSEAANGATVVIGFMGGEPMLNRELVHDIVPYAERSAAESGRRTQFSITTNATLLEPADVQLFSEHQFHVTVSLDGPPELNDAQRRLPRGGSSFERVQRSLELFDRIGRPRHLSARATVTPRVGSLPHVLDTLLELGFDSVGFAPVLRSPDPSLAFEPEQLDSLLEQMCACGRRSKSSILRRQRYPFSNFETALSQIERGTHRPYPCGAGAAYLSVNADGELYACHRLVDDPRFHFGNLTQGSDTQRRRLHLAERHVDTQEPCRSCWARYLCGGGCYHEVSERGRVACDYIRGWLRFCIAAYAEIKQCAPDYFEDPTHYFSDTVRAP